MDDCPKCDIGQMEFNSDGIEECDNCGHIDPEDLADSDDDTFDNLAMMGIYDDDEDGPQALEIMPT